MVAMAAGSPVPASVAVAKLYATCQRATTSTEWLADRYSQVRNSEPKPMPTTQPSAPATPSSRKLPTIQNRGRCHGAHTAHTISAVRPGLVRRSRCSASTPRHPISSPKPLTTITYATVTTPIAGAPEYRRASPGADPRATATSDSIAVPAIRPYQTGRTRQRSTRPHRSERPVRPSVAAVAAMPASAGAARPGRWLGHPSPGSTTSPRTAIGIHQDHDRR